MEVTGIAALGIYLLLAFVLPGFCYAFVFGLCFPQVITTVLKTLNEQREAPRTEASSSTKQEGMARALSSLTIPAITGGLLLSSVCFFVENVSRNVAPCFMDRVFPEFGIAQISKIEAAGKGALHLQVLSGEAIMHFNIGVGILLLAFAYLGFGRRRAALVICLFVTAFANIVDSSVLYQRASKAAADVVKQLTLGELAAPGGPSH